MDNIILNLKDVEKVFEIKIKRNMISLGLDTASKTGYCIAKTDDVNIILDVGYFKIDVKGIKDKKLRRRLLAENIFKNLKRIFTPDGIGFAFPVVVIEDVFFGRNVHTVILLSRIGGIAYALAQENGAKKITWATASEARKTIGLKGNAKKQEITNIVNTKLGLDIKNDDIVDAIVLALNGLKEK